MKCYTRKLRKNRVVGFTFPAMTMELSPEIIKHAKLEQPLKRLASILAKKYAGTCGGSLTVGINFTGVDFSLLFQDQKDGGI